MADLVLRDDEADLWAIPGQAEAVAALVDELSAAHSVDRQTRPLRPGVPTASALGDVAIYVVGGVSTPLLARLGDDLYSMLKAWAQQRVRDRQAANPQKRAVQMGTIYGPDGKILRQYNSLQDDEL